MSFSFWNCLSIIFPSEKKKHSGVLNTGCHFLNSSWNYSLTSEHQAPTQQGRASRAHIRALTATEKKNTHSSQKHHHWYIYMFTSLFWEQCEICTINTVTALLIKFSKLLIKVLWRIISSKTPNLMHVLSRPNDSHTFPDMMLTICSVKCNHSYPEGLLLFSLSQ